MNCVVSKLMFNGVLFSILFLFQMNLINATSVHVFDEITVDAEHMIWALHVDNEQNIYALSDRQVGVFHKTSAESHSCHV